MNLLLHPKTEQRLKAYETKPSHAVALIGSTGNGKASIALALATNLLQEHASDLTLLTVQPDEKGTISIEQARHISHFLRLKSVIRSTVNRVVIIEDAHHLTTEAQQALLKTIEEPAPGTVLILTVSNEEDLLPTVKSRLSKIVIQKPSADQFRDYFSKTYQSQDIERAMLISGRRPGLMVAILSSKDHPLLRYIQEAKHFVRGTKFERLAAVDSLAKQGMHEILDALSIVCQAGFRQAVQSHKHDHAERWHRMQAAVAQAQSESRYNANTKLLLTNLAMSW